MEKKSDMLKAYIKNKEKDLKHLIELLPKIRKIENAYIISEIETIISKRILIEAKQIIELKEIGGNKNGKITKQKD